MTDWTTTNYICPKVRASAPSLISNLISRTHFCRDLRNFMTPAGHFSSSANITLTRYLKEVTWARGIPWAVITDSAPARFRPYMKEFYIYNFKNFLF